MVIYKVQIQKSGSTLYIHDQCKIPRRILGSKKHKPAGRLKTAKPVFEAGQPGYSYIKLYTDGVVSR